MSETSARADRHWLDEIIQGGVDRLLAEQSPDGTWKHGFEMGVMPDAQTAIFLHLLGFEDQAWTDGLLERIKETQNADGSWGPYSGARGDVSTTVECYYALTLYDAWTGDAQRYALAETFIINAGGLSACRNLTKVLLALGGEVSWQALPSAGLYAWLWCRLSPVQMRDMVTFTRLHVASMVVLCAQGFVSPRVTTRMLSHLGRAKHVRHAVIHETLLPVPRFLVRRCRQYLHSQREQDGTLAGYHSSTFLFLMTLAMDGYAITHPDMKATLLAIRCTWGCPFSEASQHQQTCDAYIWNTALTLSTLKRAGIDARYPSLHRAARYLADKQQSAQWDVYDQRYTAAGGWGFSSRNTRHPDTDDTVACLDALANRSDFDFYQWRAGLQWLLDRQNKDGGWAAFDHNCTRAWMEKIPANDMRHAIADPSTPDVTGRVTLLLLEHGEQNSTAKTVCRARRFLLRTQERDGSWYGRWGATYIYGTWCVVRALCATGHGPTDHEAGALSRAGHWLLSIQNHDGSFGESCHSDEAGHYTPLHQGVVSQTAWALDTLLSLYDARACELDSDRLQRAIESAVIWLVEAREDGQWRDIVPTGSAFPGALHIRYHLYPKLWPIHALARYRDIFTPTMRQIRNPHTSEGHHP